MNNQNDISQALCESRESDKVIRFLNENHLSDEIIKMINNGQIWGVCLNDSGEVVAEDIWGEIHENILRNE